MKTPEPYSPVASVERRSGQDFLRQRLTRFGLSMIMMGICFPLYYLGLFGTVEGPLNPAILGAKLAGMGILKTHMLVFFLSFLIIVVTWNWIYNWVCLLFGLRSTCLKTLNHEGTVCGAPVTKKKVVHKKTGTVIPRYVCTHGHKGPEAHFHPINKGTVNHTLWVIFLCFCIIVFFML